MNKSTLYRAVSIIGLSVALGACSSFDTPPPLANTGDAKIRIVLNDPQNFYIVPEQVDAECKPIATFPWMGGYNPADDTRADMPPRTRTQGTSVERRVDSGLFRLHIVGRAKLYRGEKQPFDRHPSIKESIRNANPAFCPLTKLNLEKGDQVQINVDVAERQCTIRVEKYTTKNGKSAFVLQETTDTVNAPGECQ